MRKRRKIETKNIRRYKAKYNRGLTLYQVNKRESEGLINKSSVKTSRTYKEILTKNLVSFFNILLIALGIILICFGLWTSCVFLVILIANITIGLIQDIRSKRIVDRLSLVNKEKITVVRDSKELEVYPEELVLDDIIILKDDVQVPCDSIVVYGECSVNEALVTGESIPLKKVEGSKLLSGTYLTNGRCYAQVENIGNDNYIERLQAKSKNKSAPKSQMYVTLNKIFKYVTFFVIILGILDILQTGIITYAELNPDSDLYKWLKEDVVRQVSGALISMIPSGMYLLTSVSLAVGIIALFKQRVAVQDMYSIETIARVDTLCIDKTGTITDGKMSVSRYDLMSKRFNPALFETLMGSFNDGVDDTNFTALALKEKFGTKPVFDAIETQPFNSVFKYSACELKDVGTIVVGAYGFVPLAESTKIKRMINEYSKKGYRTLVVGFSKKSIKNGKIPADLELISIIILQDHIRTNAKSIIEWFQNNDVNIKVISGDNELTVSEIAKAVNVNSAEKYISLDGKSDEEVKKLALEYNIFGRVTPEQKELIVTSLKEQNHTVAMFGDGVNDLLGLRSADVSISIRSGSKAAKDISSLILLDNDFKRLTNVVAQGRRVINNLQRTCSLFLTKTVFAILLNIFFLVLGTITYTTGKDVVLWPFFPNTFYAWELVSIGIASFFLALEPNNERIKGSFVKNITRGALPGGIIISLTIIGYYLFSSLTGFTNNPDIDRTIATYVISVSSIVVLFGVCFPFNLYRSLVFGGATILVFILFMWSIYSIPELNFLEIYPFDAPRYLEDAGHIWAIFILILISCAVMLAEFFLSKYIRNRKGLTR